jgi:hypothetical protein
MTAAVIALATLVAVALGGFLKVIVASEMRGGVADRCHDMVDRAAALLPPHVAQDVADEWRAELAVLVDADRLVSAWRFARRLPAAARGMREVVGHVASRVGEDQPPTQREPAVSGPPRPQAVQLRLPGMDVEAGGGSWADLVKRDASGRVVLIEMKHPGQRRRADPGA